MVERAPELRLVVELLQDLEVLWVKGVCARLLEDLDCDGVVVVLLCFWVAKGGRVHG